MSVMGSIAASAMASQIVELIDRAIHESTNDQSIVEMTALKVEVEALKKEADSGWW